MSNHGFNVRRVKDGCWYSATGPGGFASAETGIFIPGCVVQTDPTTRQVVKAVKPPVQLPSHRIIQVWNEREGKFEIEERPFTWFDDRNPSLCDGLDSALGTGLIIELPDEEVQKRFPQAWSQRRERRLFDRDNLLTRDVDMNKLREQFYAEVDTQRAAR